METFAVIFKAPKESLLNDNLVGIFSSEEKAAEYISSSYPKLSVGKLKIKPFTIDSLLK